MPPRLRDYGLNDWLHLRPLTHAVKTRRYRSIDRVYSRLAAPSMSPIDLISQLQGRRVLISIAFTDPQTIDWQAQLVKLYVPNVLYVVADNTPNDIQAAAIASVAKRHDIPYVRLPANPWNEPSRSHGLALNWVWRNIVLPGAPHVFGFLDDDIYPTAPADPFVALDSQDWFGVVRPEGPMKAGSMTKPGPSRRWFLWAGFSMFRFDAVRDKPLDFSQDWFLRLDTGGANWDVIYRHISRDDFSEQPTIFVPYKEGLDVTEAPFQWCGDWLHEVGVMGRAEFTADKRIVVSSILEPHLEKARTAKKQIGPID